ncbi:hypothetical protein Sbal117_4556 (plasmid) [Shewanella baltica OS117]|nr:hypothetical protein Sbal117_4556 [Shewanella baltica OS117]
MIVSRPINNENNDLLVGCEQSCLLIRDLKDNLVLCQKAPDGGWTHDALEAFDYYQYSPYGWDAYLGNKDNWIGSSEV